MPTVKKSQRPAWLPERKPHERRVKANTAIYNGKQWRNLAMRHKIANPICVHCEAKGIVSPVEVTDHILPINQGGQPYAWDNLQSLCNACHAVKSGKEAHDAQRGQEAQREGWVSDLI